jgi:photosystem II stability/assembly factor-like uncharacterized protein
MLRSCSAVLGLSLCGFAAACAAFRGAGDGGNGRWQHLAAPTRASLRGLGALDAARAWVGGAGGEVWRTTDGGTTWRNVSPPGAAACDFRDVELLGPEQALVLSAGDAARVYRTDDGGVSWRVVLADTRKGAFFDAMAFAGETGVLFADPLNGGFCLWTTRDGGASWQPVGRDLLPAPLPGEAAFAASGTCVVATGTAAAPAFWIATGGSERARLLRGGFGRWRAEDVPLAAGAPSRGGFGLAVHGSHAVLVGGDYAAPTVSEGSGARSEDGGETWQPIAGGVGGYRSAVLWLDDARLLAVGSDGTSLSTDQGRTWRVVAGEGFHALARGADGTVWAAGAAGRIARWIDAR